VQKEGIIIGDIMRYMRLSIVVLILICTKSVFGQEIVDESDNFNKYFHQPQKTVLTGDVPSSEYFARKVGLPFWYYVTPEEHIVMLNDISDTRKLYIYEYDTSGKLVEFRNLYDQIEELSSPDKNQEEYRPRISDKDYDPVTNSIWFSSGSELFQFQNFELKRRIILPEHCTYLKRFQATEKYAVGTRMVKTEDYTPIKFQVLKYYYDSDSTEILLEQKDNLGFLSHYNNQPMHLSSDGEFYFNFGSKTTIHQFDKADHKVVDISQFAELLPNKKIKKIDADTSLKGRDVLMQIAPAVISNMKGIKNRGIRPVENNLNLQINYVGTGKEKVGENETRSYQGFELNFLNRTNPVQEHSITFKLILTNENLSTPQGAHLIKFTNDAMYFLGWSKPGEYDEPQKILYKYRYKEPLLELISEQSF
jgi:hypothetical protein